MSTSQGPSDPRSAKAKSSQASGPAQPSSNPTSFFLFSEKEMDRRQRGRRESRSSATAHSTVHDSHFGVQSLEETISSAFGSSDSLSRTDSNSTGVSPGPEDNVDSKSKRKAGNPVHPKIAAAGQRIISGDHLTALRTASPVSTRSGPRRPSVSSSINVTPSRMSPHHESTHACTPRSGSPKSIRLSDDDASMAEETGSQAIQSSSGDDEAPGPPSDTKDESMPQLVMPTVAMPSRRPFTERGKQMGRLKILVVGPDGVGKTSFIQSIFRTCEDIVHVDQSPEHSIIHSSTLSAIADDNGVSPFVENQASTKAYPSWWTDLDSRRMLSRRKSFGEGVLDRNLCFIDTPGTSDETGVRQVSAFVDSLLRRISNMQTLNDSELIHLLSGEGGLTVDAVLWLFDSDKASQLSTAEWDLLRSLAQMSNVVPLIARSDRLTPELLSERKARVQDLLESSAISTYSLGNGIGDTEAESAEPFAISSALQDDSETIDASVLMSSQYLTPLVQSDLQAMTEQLLDPENMAKMRHVAATKFLLWRQQNLGLFMNTNKASSVSSIGHAPSSPAFTGRESMADDPSKVLVPHSSSSFYRSASPSGTDLSGNVAHTSTHALAKFNEHTQTTEPFRQVRLAKWAQDLQRSLENEHRRYKQWYFSPPGDWTSHDGEKAEEQALVTTREAQKPAKGRLGGDVAVIDPRDPLGLLAFSQTFGRKGMRALRLVGSFGLLGAAAYWVTRNWTELQELLGFGQQQVIHAPAMPAPTSAARGTWDSLDWKSFFGWER